jgi:hypothetical protein
VQQANAAARNIPMMARAAPNHIKPRWRFVL